MSIEAELKTKVIADATVAAITTRYYGIYAPEEAAAPYIVARRMSTPRLGTMEGPDTPYPRFRLSCWAATYEGAITLADAVREAIDGDSGTWGAATVQQCRLTDESDAFEPSPELLERMMFGRHLDFEIWFRE